MAAVYTILSQDKTQRSKKMNTVQIAYSADPYSSGLSVDGSKLGLPNSIESINVIDSGSGLLANFNGGKIRLFEQDGASGPLVEVSGNQTVTIKAIVIGF